MNIHELEALANQICEGEIEKKEHLARMIRAYARILNIRERAYFKPKALRFQDEDGHFDNSYPPDQIYTDSSGPRLAKIVSNSTDQLATSGGFYHSWKLTTTDLGLYVAPDGSFYGCRESGTGNFGQFAAHPGDCDVSIDREFEPLDMDEIPLDRLVKAESEMRAKTFPLIAAREQSTTN